MNYICLLLEKDREFRFLYDDFEILHPHPGFTIIYVKMEYIYVLFSFLGSGFKTPLFGRFQSFNCFLFRYKIWIVINFNLLFCKYRMSMPRQKRRSNYLRTNIRDFNLFSGLQKMLHKNNLNDLVKLIGKHPTIFYFIYSINSNNLQVKDKYNNLR